MQNEEQENIIEIENNEQLNEIIENDDNENVIVDFYAEWCGPCKRLEPIIESIAESEDYDVTIAKVDVDNNREIASDYEVQGVPTLHIFSEEGRNVFVGLTEREEIVKNLS